MLGIGVSNVDAGTQLGSGRTEPVIPYEALVSIGIGLNND